MSVPLGLPLDELIAPLHAPIVVSSVVVRLLPRPTVLAAAYWILPWSGGKDWSARAIYWPVTVGSVSSVSVTSSLTRTATVHSPIHSVVYPTSGASVVAAAASRTAALSYPRVEAMLINDDQLGEYIR